MIMASSTLLLCLASLLIFISTSNAITDQQISQICSKAISSPTCLKLLHTIPGVPSADLKGTGNIVLDVSKSKASQTKSIIPGLAGRATNPTLKQRYNACIGFYNDAVSDIGEAKQAMNGNDPGTMNQRVTAAQTEIVDCTDQFSTAPADPSDLPARSKDVFETLSVALVISNML